VSVKTLKTLPLNASFEERSFDFTARGFFAVGLAVEVVAGLLLGLLECAAMGLVMGLRYHPASFSSIGAAEGASNRRRHWRMAGLSPVPGRVKLTWKLAKECVP